MLPSRHIIISLSLGSIIWFFTKSLWAVMLCLIGGILIDIDHLFDCAIHYGLRRLKLKEIYRACGNLAKREEDGGPEKLRLFFHAGELAIFLWAAFLFSNNIYLLALALGYSTHLMMDMAANVLKPWAYFISWRICRNFKTATFLRDA